MCKKVVICVFLAFNLSGVYPLLPLRRPILLDPPENVTTLGTRITTNLFFEQKVDNFNAADGRTWLQRYHINEDYYNETSRNHVFLLLGGEWEATERWLNYGAWIDTAKQYGALLIYLEHRYYGVSQPFSDISTENLQYLTVPQALEDTAQFIQGINSIYNLTTDEVKWIAFGGSYAGTLAAWLRLKYPTLVAGAMSSSGPLEAVLDFTEYLQVVRNSLETHSTSCTANIKEAFAQLDELTTSCLEDTEVYEELNDMFELCDSIEFSEGNEKDLASLFEYIVDYTFAYVVQYNGMLTVNIDTVCDIMVNETAGTQLQKLAQAHVLLSRYIGENCTDYKYANLVAGWQNTTIVPSDMMRQWVYQTCTEFGFFQTSSQEDPIFGSRFDITFFTDLCVDVFGEKFNETLIVQGIEATNNRYGAQNIAASNIVYFHGNIDPWHALGKLQTTDDIQDRVIIVEGVAHCANMQAASENDPAALTAARKEIDELIGQWLGVSGTDDGSDGDGGAASRNIVSLYTLNVLLFIVYLIH